MTTFYSRASYAILSAAFVPSLESWFWTPTISVFNDAHTPSNFTSPRYVLSSAQTVLTRWGDSASLDTGAVQLDARATFDSYNGDLYRVLGHAEFGLFSWDNADYYIPGPVGGGPDYRIMWRKGARYNPPPEGWFLLESAPIISNGWFKVGLVNLLNLAFKPPDPSVLRFFAVNSSYVFNEQDEVIPPAAIIANTSAVTNFTVAQSGSTGELRSGILSFTATANDTVTGFVLSHDTLGPLFYTNQFDPYPTGGANFSVAPSAPLATLVI